MDNARTLFLLDKTCRFIANTTNDISLTEQQVYSVILMRLILSWIEFRYEIYKLINIIIYFCRPISNNILLSPT